jgi:hypothetical protein
MRPKRQSIRLKGKSVRSDATTKDENSLTYQESIAAQELLMMMIMMEMTLVVVPPHLSHKGEVMSDLSLPS